RLRTSRQRLIGRYSKCPFAAREITVQRSAAQALLEQRRGAGRPSPEHQSAITCPVRVHVLAPMLASSAGALPVVDAWTYEVKWDGYRTLALKEGKRVQLLSRNLNDATADYPSVARAIAEVRADSVLLDGEVVALDDRGHPSFQALHHGLAQTIVFYAFDV